MMYRCENCGNLFEEGEQAVWEERHGLDSPPYEKFSGCPICHGDYEEVHQCKKCGDWHSEDELYEGWCEKCLRESINYDNFLEYCEDHKDEQYLDIFVMSELLGGMDCPKHSTVEFHSLMVDCYKREVRLDRATESVIGRKTSLNFLDRCIRFIMDDDGSTGREIYAEWLNKRDGKQMEILTVGDFAKICKTDIKVMSGFNGKVLCKRFDPKKHTEIASREIVSVWSEIEASKSMGYRNFAHANMCVFVNGAKECSEHYGVEVK